MAFFYHWVSYDSVLTISFLRWRSLRGRFLQWRLLWWRSLRPGRFYDVFYNFVFAMTFFDGVFATRFFIFAFFIKAFLWCRFVRAFLSTIDHCTQCTVKAHDFCTLQKILEDSWQGPLFLEFKSKIKIGGSADLTSEQS